MAEKDKTHKGKTFDVSHPGKSAPSATSRPVIIGHGPMMQDPMVQAAAESKEEVVEPKAKSAEVVSEKVIEAPESLKAEVPEEPEVEETLAEKPDEAPADDDEEAVVDAVAGKAADKKQQDEDDKKATEQAAHIASLIEEKTYFVPINVAKHKRSSRAAMIVLACLLIGVAAGSAAYFAGFFG